MDFRCSVPRKLVRVWYHFKWFLKLYNLSYSDTSFDNWAPKSLKSRNSTYLCGIRTKPHFISPAVRLGCRSRGVFIRQNLIWKLLKTRVFTHRLTHALMGRHCPSKYKFPNEWMFEDSCIYENVVAIGQPTGYITLIDMNSQKMILELSVFEQQIQAMRHPKRFRWNEG